MKTTWLFTADSDSQHLPKIASQISRIDNHLLTLRNPWVTDSVFMAKIYTGMTLGLIATVYPDIINDYYHCNQKPNWLDIAILIIFPLILTPFIAYRIFYIKNLSAIYLNRDNRTIYYQRLKQLITIDWDNARGGIFTRFEFSSSGFSTSYGLAFVQCRSDGSPHQKDALWIDSNSPNDPDVKYVAEAWEYMRHYMDHGLENLPPLGEPNWFYAPLHEICLTPLQAWRHYAPWRTGEVGEMQGKKLWMLPFWAILFPYNLSVAISWYVICRLFNVKAAAAPVEALEKVSVKTPEAQHL